VHPLLQRNLRRLGLSDETPPADAATWRALLDRFSELCYDVDRERYMLERSISISSREMQELYAELKRSSASMLAQERDRLKNSLAVLNAALETVVDGVLVVDERREVVMFNQRFAAMFGVPDAMAQRRHDNELTAHITGVLEDSAEFFLNIERSYETPLATSFDEIRLVDGRIIDRFSAPVRAMDGTSTYGRMWVYRDVTEQRTAAQETRRLNRFLDSIIEHVPGMLSVKDADTLSFVRLNRASESLLGWTETELVGKSDQDLFSPEEAERLVAEDREVLAGGRVVELPVEPVVTRDGDTRLLQTTKVPITDELGVPRYLLAISHDITDIKRYERELTTALAAAQDASRAKSEFLANVSHELRTPLNAIIGFAEILRDGMHGELNTRQQRDIQHVLTGGRHLLELITDILDLARVESGHLSLELTSVDAVATVRDVCEMISPLAERRGVGVVELSRSTPIMVHVDPVRLRQILFNLLSNAAKFTESGGQIGVSLECGADAMVHVRVSDTGIGIAAADQQRIFAPFEQVEGSYGRKHQGTGLGLAVTKRLVEALQGRIEVESVLGEGSTFSFSLPRAVSDESSPPRRRISSGKLAVAEPQQSIVVIKDC
jgi:PAS domain S-box-containing protein